MPSLSPKNAALARHNGYQLLGRLFLEGLTTELLPFVNQVEVLTAVTPHPFKADESAASYQNTFGFNIFPFASIFLDDSGLLGGVVTAKVVKQYQQGGFKVQSDADHIGHELGHLSHLCQSEIDAIADNATVVLPHIHQLQSNFIHTQLLSWLPIFTIALERSNDQFFKTATDITLSLVVEHGDALEKMGCLKDETAVSNQKTAPPNLLANDKTSLKDIARFLITPPHSGIYLSRDKISALARNLSLPRGFGNRQQMLLNLMRVAAEYDLLSQLITNLEAETAVWQSAYENQQTDMPILRQHLKPWLTRIQNTIHFLEEIKSQAKLIAN